jgi:hypothetical protein
MQHQGEFHWVSQNTLNAGNPANGLVDLFLCIAPLFQDFYLHIFASFYWSFPSHNFGIADIRKQGLTLLFTMYIYRHEEESKPLSQFERRLQA